MILTCPSCQARYLIPASAFSTGARMVRCARCGHSWLASLPDETAGAPAVPDLAPAPERVNPVPPGSNLPVLFKAAMPPWLRRALVVAGLAAAALLALWMISNRQGITRDHPWLEPFYDKIGFHIYHPGDGLSLQQVRSEMRFEDGGMHLYVEGMIHNESKKIQLIPDLLAGAVGPDGKVMQSWQIDAPAAKVGPGESVGFHSSIRAPKGTIVEINLDFIAPHAVE